MRSGTLTLSNSFSRLIRASFRASSRSVFFFTFFQRHAWPLALATSIGIDSLPHRSLIQPAMSHTSITTRSTARSLSASSNAAGVEKTVLNTGV